MLRHSGSVSVVLSAACAFGALMSPTDGERAAYVVGSSCLETRWSARATASEQSTRCFKTNVPSAVAVAIPLVVVALLLLLAFFMGSPTVTTGMLLATSTLRGIVGWPGNNAYYSERS